MHIDVGFQPNRSNLQSPLLWHSGWTTRKLCWLGRPNFHYDLRNRVKLLIYGYDRIVSKTASDCFHTHLRRCWCTRLLHCSQWEGYFHPGIQLSWVPQWVDMDLWNSKRRQFMTDYPVATVIAGQSSWKQCAVESHCKNAQFSTISTLTGAKKQSLPPSIRLFPSRVNLKSCFNCQSFVGCHTRKV